MSSGGNPYFRFLSGLATLTHRRAVGLAFVGGILVAPVALGTELAPSARVGILSTLGIRLASPNTKSFVAELRRLGYIEGRNLTIDFRSAEDKPARLPDLARELVRLAPDVILSLGTMESTVAAMKATATIPIVFVHAVDPVRTGLVASLPRPGGNVTGVTSLNADLGAKRLELITDILPGVRRVAILVSPVDPETASMIGAVKSAARARRVDLNFVEIRDSARLGGAESEIAKAGAGALLVLGSPPLYRLSPLLAELTAKHRLPAVSAWREFPEAGGLASYGTAMREMFQRAAGLVDRLLKGAKPSDLPIQQPTKFELVVNLKTAKALGITIPQSILVRADEVMR
ncbi:MAG TPA: ABC transporter substrate-binding protein [Burkholderiales bacterium]|nr:ABC transporter substrate-binding protein [Burkholderiales bacterium]